MSHDLTAPLTAKLMAQLFDVTSDAIIVVDATQRVVRFNRGAEKIFGYHANEVLGQPLDVLLPERLARAHQTHVQQFGAGGGQARDMGERRAISGRRKDGGEFPGAADISKLEQDGQQLFAVILRDVAEQRRLEAEARAQSTQTAIAAERNRLARDLHDAVTQSLFSASLMAEVLPKLWESDREKGLAEATHCRSRVSVTVHADEQRHLSGDVQEALHNVSKHSKAKTATVQLSLLPRNASLLVHDDGRGFEYTGIGATHLGLRIMHERAEELGATVQIESAPGQGTDVLVNWSET